jgi:hypothetical protein
MGAWGFKYYEDDDAFDFMDEIEASENPKELIEDALETALESDFIDSTEEMRLLFLPLILTVRQTAQSSLKVKRAKY